MNGKHKLIKAPKKFHYPYIIYVLTVLSIISNQVGVSLSDVFALVLSIFKVHMWGEYLKVLNNTDKIDLVSIPSIPMPSA